jgi:hypothetical protein
MRENMQILSFSAWLIWFNIMICSSIHFPAIDRISFFMDDQYSITHTHTHTHTHVTFSLFILLSVGT